MQQKCYSIYTLHCRGSLTHADMAEMDKLQLDFLPLIAQRGGDASLQKEPKYLRLLDLLGHFHRDRNRLKRCPRFDLASRHCLVRHGGRVVKFWDLEELDRNKIVLDCIQAQERADKIRKKAGKK